MKSHRNHIVIEKWKRGQPALNHRKSLASVFRPDGSAELYSYDLKIGHRTAGGACIVANYTAPGGDFKSMTTSQHVNLAKKVGSYPVVMHPLVWCESPLCEMKPF